MPGLSITSVNRWSETVTFIKIIVHPKIKIAFFHTHLIHTHLNFYVKENLYLSPFFTELQYM